MSRRHLAVLAAAAAAFAAFTAAAPAAARPQVACSAASRQVAPFTEASVAQSPDGKLSVRWRAPAVAGPVAIYASRSPDGADGVRLARRQGPSGQVELTAPAATVRWHVTLRPACGEALTLADRSLRLQGAPNFRDLGGYRTSDGRWVRMGVLFRADALDQLTPGDLATLSGLGVKQVADLRTELERSRQPDRTPPGAVHVVYDITGEAVQGVTQDSFMAARGRLDTVLEDANRQFVADPRANGAFRKLVAQFQRGENPTVFHCTAGKDRTGWAAAVLLTALGVPRETVMSDYLLSADYLAPKNKILLPQLAKMPGLEKASPDQLEALLSVRRAYLEAGFDEVEKRYGSFDNYLREGLGLTDADLAALRARYLVGAPTAS